MERTAIYVALSFDTTGSMFPCITEVRRKAVKMVEDLFNTLGARLRIAIIAHGDYCDKDNPYTIKYLDFSQNPRQIVDFINEVENTYGGDADECYELVLHTAHKLSWGYETNAHKALVVIGDANPHESSYSLNRDRLNWRIEAHTLASNDIKIYACHAMADIRRSSTQFYKTIAEIGCGVYVTLAQFSSLPHLLMGIMYKESSSSLFEEYVQKVEAESSMSRDLHMSFTNMGSKTIKPIVEATRTYGMKPRSLGISTMHSVVATVLVPVSPSRFQVFTVDHKQSIKNFVNNQHIMFEAGRGFYELTKSVKVQQHKEIILVDKKTKDIYTGPSVRALLGLSPQVKRGSASLTERLSSHSLLADYDVFIQSTSYNRELLGNTLFMYEVSGWDKDTVFPHVTKAERVFGADSISLTGRVRTEPEMASIPVSKKTKKVVAPPKDSVLMDIDYSAIEARLAGAMGIPISAAKEAIQELAKKTEEERKAKKADAVPSKFHMPKQLFDYRQANPDMTWDAIAAKFAFGSGSGARKAAKRYSDFISK